MADRPGAEGDSNTSRGRPSTASTDAVAAACVDSLCEAEQARAIWDRSIRVWAQAGRGGFGSSGGRAYMTHMVVARTRTPESQREGPSIE